MQIDRRSLSFGLGAITLSACVSEPQPNRPNPLLRLAQNGKSKVYLFGFADAKDDSWLAPKVAHALDETTELWVETPLGTSAPQGGISPVVNDLGYDRSRDLFTVLPSELSQRVEAYAATLDLTRERLSPMKPWLAREAIQRAWVAKQGAPTDALTPHPYPDQTVIARMKAKGVPIYSEYATLDDVLRGFATLSDQGQIEYLTNLLDYFDGDQAGANEDVSGWIYGHPSERLILEQKAKTPALYAAMHFERNKWWAARIEGWLQEDGVRFALVGLNHVLGPDSIQIAAERRGIVWKFV